MGEGKGTPVRRTGLGPRKAKAWQRAYERAVLAVPEVLKMRAYRQVDAFTHVIVMEGECGTDLLSVTRVSRESACHAQQLCEHAWCEWVADRIVPGRNGLEKHWPVQGEPVPVPPRPRPHIAARRHQAPERTRVVG